MTALKAAMEKAMSKLSDGGNRFDEINALATSIRCKIVPDIDVYGGKALIITIPDDALEKGSTAAGGFKIPLPEEEGIRFQKWMKERRMTSTSKLHVALEDDGYIRFSIKR